jgi:uncharacterized protein YrrD
MNKVLSKLINKELTSNKMRKGNDVIGKVVVTYNTGEKIERIRDLIFDQKRNQLLGFLVEEKRLFRDAKVIALQDVQAIGLDAIVVHSNKSVVRARAIPAIKEILSQNNVLIGTKILTTEGLDLGRLVDLFFDEHSGLVEGYEVSGGVFADAYSGRSFVPAPETLNIGYDVAFVPPETAQMMEAQVGGVRGAIQATEDKFQSSVENVNLGLREASQSAAQQLQTATDATSSKLQNLNRDALTSVTNNLVDPSGSLSANIKRNLQPVIESTKSRIQNAAQGSVTKKEFSLLFSDVTTTQNHCILPSVVVIVMIVVPRVVLVPVPMVMVAVPVVGVTVVVGTIVVVVPGAMVVRIMGLLVVLTRAVVLSYK